MFYRRKLILALLEAFGGRLKKIDLQKLLFLVCNKQEKPTYEFIPYLYGCYSHSARADLTVMVDKELLDEDEDCFKKKGRTSYLKLLDEKDRQLVNQAYVLFKKTVSNALIRHTYVHFPYFAINSTIAGSLLSPEELEKVNKARPSRADTTLYTIGYEGISLEAYLNKLVLNDIKLLIDVRNNPLSQKFGFSKSQLIRYCKGLNIDYLHFPDVGIQSEHRQELRQQSDYDALFDVYKKETIVKTKATQDKILDLLQQKKRIALTCFEANICQCHRKHLAEALIQLPGWKYDLKHI